MSDTSGNPNIEHPEGWLGDLLGGIPIVGPIIKDIGGAIFDGVKAVGGALTDAGISGLAAVVASLTTGIGSLVDSISTTLGSIIDPITSIVGSVSGLANDIQDKIIGPIVTPITTTITQVGSLTNTIGKLVDEGLPGILQIPKALADSLKGIQNSWSDSTRMLADANAKVASETLVPGITSAVAPGLKDIHGALLSYTTNLGLDVDAQPFVSISEGVDASAVIKNLEALRKQFEDPKTLVQWGMWIGLKIIEIVPLVEALNESTTETVKQQVRAARPEILLGVAEMLSATTREIISEPDASLEFLKSGINGARQKVLSELNTYLPSVDEAASWMLRGLINADEYTQILKHNSRTPAQIQAHLAALKPLVSPQILLDMAARGIIDEKALDDGMRAQGYNDDQIKEFTKAGIAPAQVQTLLAAKGNLYAGLNGWFPETYASVLPDDLVNAAHANRIDVTQAAAQWTAHWSAMPIQTAINLFFRGRMNRQEVQYVVGQNNYPPEMADLFISAQEALLAPRTIPAMLARGAIDENTARAELHARGYNDTDINTLIDDAKVQFNAKKKAPAAHVTHLTISEITEAHADGVLSDNQYSELMKEHGFDDSEIAVLTGLNEYKTQKKAKADLVATLKAEVALGVKTAADVQTDLASSGFTTSEIERVLVSLRQAKRQVAKLPSLAEMSSMAKKSIITREDLLAGIQAIGYAAPWDQRLVDLTFSAGAASGGSQTST